MDAQILISAGHEGGKRNGGGSTDPRNAVNTYGSSGTFTPEREMTPLVANQATRVLTDAGYTVIREDAFFVKKYEVELAVSLHFDGSSPSCASKASVGYPGGSPPGSNKPTADTWKSIYGQYWPFGFMPDNFTGNLSGYYGYAFTSTTIAEMLIEFGEITCPDQDEWLQPRVLWLGDLVAHFCSVVVGGPFIADPGEYLDNEAQERLRRARVLHKRLGRQLEALDAIIGD